MKSYLAPLVLLVAVGCSPNNATITDGSYTAFLSYTTSRSIQKSSADWPEKFPGHLLVDCRDLDPEAGEELVPGADSDDALTACRDFGREHELWLEYDAYHIVSGPLEPWRGEAIITSEGDLQVTFHNRLPDGQDFRFAFVVDPQFQPRECRQNDAGEPELSDVQGDWIGNWTNDVDGEGSMFYLNAGSYQFNPNDTEVAWIFPDEWAAGFAIAKFAEEDVYARSVRYGKPDAYAGYELDASALTSRDLFYASLEEGTDPTTNPDWLDLRDSVALGDVEQADCFDDAATGISREVECELNNFTQHLPEPHVTIDTKVHDNAWRVPDGSEAGLDGWIELQYNWVHFDEDREDLAIGNPASGEFNLVLDATESQSRVLVKGTFEIEEIKKDHNTVQDLSAEKLEEYGTEYCGEPAQGN